ncbi:MAG: hypothetical protein H6828_02265 [Planctomycetes bacterium]|nr:hypothetical protein [Planctomycetota bacterium]
MKHLSRLTLALGLVAATLVTPTRSAAAAPAGGHGTPDPACLQACLEQLIENLEGAKSSCWVCDFWLFGCIIGHHDQDCLKRVRTEIFATYDNCIAHCTPA